MRKTTCRIPAILIALVVSLASIKTEAQNGSKGQWLLTVRGGSSKLMTEIQPGFTGSVKEFQNKGGFTGDVAISRTFMGHWESGIGIQFNNLTSKDSTLKVSDLSLWGSEEPGYPGKYFYMVPIEYKATSFVPNAFIRYYFREFPKRSTTAGSVRFDPYLELSMGPNMYKSKLQYIKEPEPGSDVNPDTLGIFPKYSESKFQVGGAIGTKVRLSGGLILNVAYEVATVGTNKLDAAPNYTETKTPLDLNGIVTRIVFGVTIPLAANKGKGGKSQLWAP